MGNIVCLCFKKSYGFCYLGFFSIICLWSCLRSQLIINKGSQEFIIFHISHHLLFNRKLVNGKFSKKDVRYIRSGSPVSQYKSGIAGKEGWGQIRTADLKKEMINIELIISVTQRPFPSYFSYCSSMLSLSSVFSSISFSLDTFSSILSWKKPSF